MKLKKADTIQKHIKLAFIFLSLMSVSILKANDGDILIGKTLTLQSKILDEERTMMVFLPENYEGSQKNYPVLYLLDGRTHFLHASGIVDFLSKNRMIPEMIVVAITNIDRTRDFSPSHAERFPTSGGANKFLSFIEKELIPHINETFRTAEFRILMGHSFGGVFTTYSLLEKPNLFKAYIAISPYMQYNDNDIVKQSHKKLQSSYKNELFFYMTIGDEPDYFAPLDEFSSLIKNRKNEDIVFEYKMMKKESHASIPHLSIYNGLLFIYSDWQYPVDKLADGIKPLDAHYKRISKKYNLTLQAPELILNQMGYLFLQKNELEKAIDVFKENVKRYPNSSNVYDSLGEAYENNKQFDFARKFYQKAYDLGVKQNHINTQIYKNNLERVKKEKK